MKNHMFVILEEFPRTREIRKMLCEQWHKKNSGNSKGLLRCKNFNNTIEYQKETTVSTVLCKLLASLWPNYASF